MRPSGSMRRAGCESRLPAALADELGAHLVVAAPVQFSHRGAEWWARVAARQAVRYDISYDPDRERWYLGHRGPPAPPRGLSSMTCGPAACWVWTSTPITWPRACSTPPATRSVNPSLSPSRPRGSKHHDATGGSVRPSAHCSSLPTSRTARRSWWRSSISPTHAPQAEKPWAVHGAGNGCAPPSPGCLPPSFAPG